MVEKARLDRRLWIGAAAVLALAAAIFIPVGRTQWDLKVYLECARVLASGTDPYTTQPIVGGDPYQCLYPPLATDLYRPFAALSRAFGGHAGERLWAALKAISLVFILFLWRRWVMKPGPDLWRILFVIVGFGNPFWMDFLSGNAGSFEHAALWGGLTAFICGRDALFAALIAVSAQPKLLPLAFLALAFASPRPKWKIFFGGVALSLALFALNELVHPGLLRGFFEQLTDPKQAWRYERGPNNCAAVGFFQHVLETICGHRPWAATGAMRMYIPWVISIVGATGFSIYRIIKGDGDAVDKRRRILFVFIAAYALLVPRLKDYSFLLLIPPTLAALESDAPLALRVAIVLFAVMNSTKTFALKMGLGPWSLLFGYYKLYAVFLVWIALLLNTPKKSVAPEESV